MSMSFITLITPHPDYFIIYLACASIVAIWVGLSPKYQLIGKIDRHQLQNMAITVDDQYQFNGCETQL